MRRLLPSPFARWVRKHLRGTVNALARRCDLDRRNLLKAVRGAPKVVAAERLAGVLSVCGLTEAQWRRNVRAWWRLGRSAAPAKKRTKGDQ